MDMITLLGLVFGIGGIVGGMVLEGGQLGSVFQFTAAVIVFGGTFGAVLVGTTRRDLKMGLSLFKKGFEENPAIDPVFVMQELIESAQLARKDSILALDIRLKNFTSPFMREVFRFVIDGVDAHVLRDLFESQIYLEEESQMAGAKIYSDAGGFAPTIGIIGAVLGLIHVMSNLSDTTKLGEGIAVAFVATIYGVGSANLIFLPLANKIRRKIRHESEVKEMILEGAIGIMGGLNPFVIREKLKPFLHENGRSAHGEAA